MDHLNIDAFLKLIFTKIFAIDQPNKNLKDFGIQIFSYWWDRLNAWGAVIQLNIHT